LWNVGVPMTYKRQYADHVKLMVGQGYTDSEIRQALGITLRTMVHWRRHHPDFRDALVRSEEQVIIACERALTRLAMGYDHVIEKAFLRPGSRIPTIVRVTERIPPDGPAAEFLLKNKRSDKWRQHRNPPPQSSRSPERKAELSKMNKARENFRRANEEKLKDEMEKYIAERERQDALQEKNESDR